MKEVGDFREIFIEEKSFGRDEKKVIQRAITKETESRWEVVRKPLDNSRNNVESDIIQFFFIRERCNTHFNPATIEKLSVLVIGRWLKRNGKDTWIGC